ncbi:MAG: disulfide bond formation protein DsbA [Candidatus Eisenbacteria bacterium]|uniref:Disulfide bond formation protein DsbA n=1 Tax=Eiseniibacteriota bacterium TaxID=2212470 RepID=A0A538SCP3_UNCEI|nr:MAG: disulfide bond formation protein DsbA [Candidatus Eisenbacteria bacterium]TMQ54892.1 MAG: disulfide bond formation protein DsbA [Candidatus Eisenbacteria bacterium]
MLDQRMQRTPVTDADWCMIDPNAPVTILEYGDFECPYCAMAAPVLERIVVENPDAIRLIYRHFPVTTVHPLSLIAAEAAEAGGAQGKFWQMHNALFANQPRFESDSLRQLSRAIGLDIRRFDREMEAHVHLQEVKQDFRRGVQDGVNGTPTLLINRVRYDGPREYDAILSAIAAVAGAREL